MNVRVSAVLTALLVASDAAAQQGSPQLPETREFRSGNVSVFPTVAVRDVGTDSNVYNDATGPKGDFTYTVTPRVYLVAPIANTRLVARGLGNLVYYRTYSDQQSINALVDGRYEVVSPGFRPFVSAGVADRRERQGYEIDLRARQIQSTASVGFDADVTALTAVTAWVGRETTAWSRDEQYLGVSLAEQLDRTNTSFAGGIRFRVTPLTTVVTAVEIERDRFDRSPLRDANSVRVGPSVDFDTSAAITGHAKVGYQAFSPLSQGLPHYRGLAASAALQYVFQDATELQVDADRDVDYSYDALRPYYLQSGGRLTVIQRVLGPFRAIAIGERRNLSHQVPGGLSFDGEHEITSTLGGGIAIQRGRQVRFTLTYERTRRTSSESAGREYERRRLLGSMSYGL
jgi:hypothetical protein